MICASPSPGMKPYIWWGLVQMDPPKKVHDVKDSATDRRG